MTITKDGPQTHNYYSDTGLHRYSTEIFITVTVCLCFFSSGIHNSWVVNAIDLLENSDNGPVKIDHNESSLLASCILIGAVFGSFLAYVCVHYWSLNKSILLSSIPFVVSFILYASWPSIYAYYLGRFLVGISGSVLMSVACVYAIEIASPEIRGTVGVSVMFAGSLGGFWCYCIMPNVDFILINWLFALIPALQFVFCLFIPESPYMLIKKGRLDAAKEVLIRVRNTEDVNKEFKEMCAHSEQHFSTPVSFERLYKDVVYRRAILFTCLLNVVQQFTGLAALNAFQLDIFNAGDRFIPKNIAGVIYNAAGVFFPFCCGVFVDRVGRKVLLIISGVSMALAMSLLGGYYYFKSIHWENIDDWGILPLVCMLLYSFGFGIGMGSLGPLYAAELLPAPIRAKASCVMTVVSSCSGILVTMSFKAMQTAWGDYSPLFIYAITTIVGVIIMVIVLPETKGKTFEEIEYMLRYGKNYKKPDLQINTP